MNHDQAVQLANRLRDNWDVPAWSDGRYDLFVEALLPFPFQVGQRAVADLIFKGIGNREYRVRVEHVTEAAGALLRRARIAEEARQDKLQITGPKDQAVGELLRATILKLERRSTALSPDRQRSHAPRRKSARG